MTNDTIAIDAMVVVCIQLTAQCGAKTAMSENHRRRKARDERSQQNQKKENNTMKAESIAAQQNQQNQTRKFQMDAKIQKAVKKAVKKLEENESMWFEYGHTDDDYTASVSAENYNLPDGDTYYIISYHKGEMPAFGCDSFYTIEELAKAALELQPDLRKWRTSTSD